MTEDLEEKERKERHDKFMALPITKCVINNKDKDAIFVFSGNKTLRKDRIVNCIQGAADFKPVGLWYARGADWLRFLYSEYVHYWEEWAYKRAAKYKSIFEIQVNEGKDKFIKTKKEAMEFTEQFGVKLRSRRNAYLINWKEVVKEYDRIECCFKDWSYSMMWLNSWSIASGCIVNRDSINSIRLFYQV